MADTSKDELLLGGGINRITTTSRRSKQVPANIVLPANLKQFKMAIKNIDFSYTLIGKDWV